MDQMYQKYNEVKLDWKFFSFSLKKLDSDQCGGTWCHQDENSSSFWKVATWQKAFRQHEAKNS